MSDSTTPKTLFQKIIDGEIPGDFVYEDDQCIAIKDLHPQAPLHYLVIPRKAVPSIMELEEEDKELMSHLVFVAKDLAEREGLKGYRLQVNVGEKAGQTIFHLHLHLMGWF